MFSSSLTRAGLVVLLAACSSSSSSSPDNADAEHKQQVVHQMHDALLVELDTLLSATKQVQSSAPAPSSTGWDAMRDATAIAAAKEAWTHARTAYEHIEGALAPIFPDIDRSLDGRYDDQLSTLASGDDALFDGSGITGLHAVERVLWADTVPPQVLTFEQTLPGYQPPAFPKTEADATAFKSELCAKMVSDAQALRDQWAAAADTIDVGSAFEGLISLMNEQREKVNKASTNEEESRYSQRTMADIRDNLAGTRRVYALFSPWIISKNDPTKGEKGDGPAIDAAITAGFAKLDAIYAKTPGDAIPEPPATWSAEAPSAEDLATPFGELYAGVRGAVAPAVPGSIVDAMNDAAVLLGIHAFIVQP